MTDRERKIHVLEMVLKTTVIQNLLLPEEIKDLLSLLEDLKGEGISVKDRKTITPEFFETVTGIKYSEVNSAPQPSNPERPQNTPDR